MEEKVLAEAAVAGLGMGYIEPEQPGGVSEILVSPQKLKKYILIPAFEVSSDDNFPRRNWPWGPSCVWHAPTNPATRKRYLLLKNILRYCKTEDVSGEMLDRLSKFDPIKYPDSIRITRKSLAEELERLDYDVRQHNIPCAKVIRYSDDGGKSKTNSINKARVVAVSTFGLTSENTFRVQITDALYVDLHFDAKGNYAGCAFLCGGDVFDRTKFPDNYLSEGFDRGLLKGTLTGMKLMVNGTDVCADILKRLEVAKTRDINEKSSRDAVENRLEERSDAEKEGRKEKSHAERLKGKSIDLARGV